MIECFGHSMAEIGFFERSSRTLVIADPLLPVFNPVLYLYEDIAAMRATFDRLEKFVGERDVAEVMLAHEEPRDAASALELVADCRSRVDAIENSMMRRIRAQPGITRAELRDGVCDEFGKVREWRALVSIEASLRSFEEQGLIRKAGHGWTATD